MSESSVATSSEQWALQLEDVTFRYGSDGPATPVLRNVSLRVRTGAITALLGPNGSGKTTLLHLLLGILKPSSGTMTIAGTPLPSRGRRELSQMIGLVPQDDGVVFDLSVFEYVLLGRAPYLGLLELPGEADRVATARVIERTGIADLSHRPVPSLSGGERQLATVARALAQQPKILLLDEPTSHLDIAHTRQVLALLRGLRGAGTTVVFTTHDPNSASAIADDVVMIRGGQVLASGPVRTVMTSENLSATYGVAVEVAEANGRQVVLVD
jgi:iron complex transport system ATP-binding protein